MSKTYKDKPSWKDAFDKIRKPMPKPSKVIPSKRDYDRKKNNKEIFEEL